MSAFATAFAGKAWPALAEQFGQTVTYHRPHTGGELVENLTVCLGPVVSVPRDDERGTVYENRRSGCFSTDPTAAGGGIADPKRGDEIELGGVRWFVESLELLSGATCRVELLRIGSHLRGKVRG